MEAPTVFRVTYTTQLQKKKPKWEDGYLNTSASGSGSLHAEDGRQLGEGVRLPSVEADAELSCFGGYKVRVDDVCPAEELPPSLRALIGLSSGSAAAPSQAPAPQQAPRSGAQPVLLRRSAPTVARPAEPTSAPSATRQRSSSLWRNPDAAALRPDAAVPCCTLPDLPAQLPQRQNPTAPEHRQGRLPEPSPLKPIVSSGGGATLAERTGKARGKGLVCKPKPGQAGPTAAGH
jgi:hypothetical protein